MPVKPEKANGIKFEMFVFDALPFARNPLVLEARRADDFSPVKNAEGVDSPRTCREDQLRQFARWFRAAGVAVDCDPTGLPRPRWRFRRSLAWTPRRSRGAGPNFSQNQP